MFNTEKYLSVKWRRGGRVYPFLDCYGVVREIRRDLRLPDWPVFEGINHDDPEMAAAIGVMMHNVSRCEPCAGAVVACYKSGLVSHVGIVVEIDGQLHVIESNPRTNVTVLPLRRFERRFVRVEYYQ